MTPKRNKMFHTPIGTFSYKYLRLDRYLEGVGLIKVDENHQVLMATKEKALADLVSLFREISDSNTMLLHLTENLRIDEKELKNLNLELLRNISKVYKAEPVKLLYEAIEGLKYA